MRLYNLKYIYQILCKQLKKAYIYCFKLNLEFYFVDEFVGLSKFEIELYRIKKLIKLLEIQIKEQDQYKVNLQNYILWMLVKKYF